MRQELVRRKRDDAALDADTVLEAADSVNQRAAEVEPSGRAEEE